ncbi:putative Zf-FLZ domain-containing protein [Medicago truncatula]|uniref:DUF581 family protein n=1 Tax=Medicago truncatula TaxID=3880 RepID=G7J4C7_MEDTR|nr:FCS-Like Zinc finger 5 isoform X1 [Medicago truncatula]AES72250.1 DUF581 family protein [Medicago truncatula]AFK35802.1 unknown [Medicago truncatula]RHN69402.1 putative Zf-FLZ domain-containing protein [Medicago truncatula]
MLLGKRPRPPIMRRTRSMSGGLSVDMQAHDQTNNLESHHEKESVMSHHNPLQPHPHHDDHQEHGINIKNPHTVVMGTETHIQSKLTVSDERLVGSAVMFPSHTNNIINPLSASAHDVIHSTPHFLRTCGLCNCRLAPGRDIYMYRGDTAFCSLECREQQIKQDKRKEKWKIAFTNKEDHRVSPPCTATAKASTAACT